MSYASTSAQYCFLTRSLLKRVIALLPTTMSYAITITSDQHCPYTQTLLKRMIALLPSTMPCANTFAQHGLYILQTDPCKNV